MGHLYIHFGVGLLPFWVKATVTEFEVKITFKGGMWQNITLLGGKFYVALGQQYLKILKNVKKKGSIGLQFF